jgi:hypothetical protein
MKSFGGPSPGQVTAGAIHNDKTPCPSCDGEFRESLRTRQLRRLARPL